MAGQLLVGFLVSMINIMIHAMATIGAISVGRAVGLKHTPTPRLHLMTVMVATVVVLTFAHGLEVTAWAFSYALVGAAPEGSDLLYFAFVNYTTLGYGDVTPVKAWQLLGPMAAMTGILMFGWSTAVLFEVLMKTLAHLDSIAAPGTPFSSADRS
ncbi:potassium channel family protein [Bradyrhizobium sp. LMTR 3]|uniref:potassium channel family protein n=1 Tax=Bradyrhizobium sp. LMTR 3 TaxID=189873 RepID=UPI00081097A3|nr:potassium channel family protein [Bradyrhizobium sp. LMTR 3]OCK54991.1 metal transporter [Bradyrhizobium sp. LMTR 3]